VQLLERNLLQSIRSNTADKRDVRREARDFGDGSAEVIWHGLSCDGSTPESNVFRGEAALLLAQALEQLPEAQRTALERRFLGQQSLRAIAEEMQRSESSVAGLIRRGLAAIQAFLPAELGELSA
jgi:RNA polymerase sigma-70 factor (ECF subfamily)